MNHRFWLLCLLIVLGVLTFLLSNWIGDKDPTSPYGIHYYSQGGVVVDGVAYFTADFSKNCGECVFVKKSDAYPYAVAFETEAPFKKIKNYNFNNTYDSVPLVVQTKSGKKLIVCHEYRQKRTKALNVDTGKIEWVSDENHPGNQFFAYSFYVDQGKNMMALGAFQNGLHAIGIEDGKTLWHVERNTRGGITPSVDQERGVVYYQFNGGFLKLNAKDGQVLKEIQVAEPNKSICGNTMLVNDQYGKFIVTYWYGKSEWDSAIRVYNHDLEMLWEKTSLSAGKKHTLTYANGRVTIGIGNLWSNQYQDNRWKVLKAWNIGDGSVAWETDLSKYSFSSICNIPYFNGYFYAETQDNSYKYSSKLFRIKEDTGEVENVLEYGRPITSCAPPIISKGIMYSGDGHSDSIVLTQLATGSEFEWSHPFASAQVNHYAVPPQKGVINVPMKEIKINIKDGELVVP